MFYKHKFVHNEDSQLWLISDTHFGHNKEFIFKKRGFKNVEEHDETLIQRWNDSVAPSDHVIHLGDFIVGAGQNSTLYAHELFGKLNGHISLIWGNHNAGVATIYKKLVQKLIPHDDRDPLEIYPLSLNERVRFMGVQMLAQVKTPEKTHLVFCSHFAHRLWYDSGKSVLSASGHSHGSDPESNPDWPHYKRLDVGVDNFGGPLNFTKFLEIMEKKEIKVLDHHDSTINPS